MLRLLAAPAVALVLGAQVGCSDDCKMDYFDWTVRVIVADLPIATGVSVCVDDGCTDLDAVGSAFEGWLDLSSNEVTVDVSITDAGGTTLASFSDRRTPTGDSCYRNLVLVADADGISWVE